MSMETDFRALLTSGPILAVVGSNPGPTPSAGPSIYPKVYATGAKAPAVRYTKASGSIGLHMQGTDGLATDTMQIDVRAQKEVDCLAVKAAIVARLHGYHGTQGGTDFRLIELDLDRGSFDQPDVTGYYTATMDFTVISRAAT